MSGAAELLPLLGVAFVFGLLIGSFLNVVIHRVPKGDSIVAPRSRCPGCKIAIAATDNIPVFSYLWLGGHCRHCSESISARYPLVEFTTGLVFAAIVWSHGIGPVTVMYWIFAAGLIAAAGIDFDEQWIPDTVSLGGLLLGLALMPTAQMLQGAVYADALRESLAGALLGGGLLWSVGFLHARISVVAGRKFDHWPGEGEAHPRVMSLDYWTWFPGLGFGDVKLMAMVGAFLGPAGVLQTIVLAAFVGLVVGLVALAGRSDAGQPFGFGPAIAVAALAGAIVPVANFFGAVS